MNIMDAFTANFIFPHLPGEGCLILSELFSSASCPPRPRPPPPPRPPPSPPPLPPPPVSPRSCLHQLPPQLPPCQLFAKLFANFPAQCTGGPQPGTKPAQCAPLDLNLGICPAQCAPLDLNLGPSQLSVHRWTSTWDLPSSVCTAGPQRPDRIPEDMPDRVLEDMSDRMP